MDNIEIKSHLFQKKVTCPVCNNVFNVNVVKINSPRIQSRDSDFFIRYSVANPYFYDVWICNDCGYAALKVDFNSLKKHQRDIVLTNIKPKWKPRVYPDIITETLAIERYKLALLNAIIIELNYSTKAMICLKISWMYRLLNMEKEELHFLNKALIALNNAYMNEGFPMYGLQRDSTMYLIGELNRRIGNYQEALIWYSKTITSLGSSYKIKELARNGRDIIKGTNV
ncbi:DUF2225 domain-containing protein [Clostridium weizhouense]|uniref:DUF2225 domain-containing protein n=1 Tax=Clostridium weizhouense TaxID=2859781 RepID=A0ABS7AQJ7_9CLOT|nr:DUF2225 domain-containing protein [Clostridium weizhouense]MBW6410824.1 DUF2225 domain-containing protein [Clostridium weizhouense]